MRKLLIEIISIAILSIAMSTVVMADTGNAKSIFSEGFKSKVENLGEIPKEVKEKLKELIITVSQAKENVNAYAEILARGEVTKNESKKNANAKAKIKADIVAKALEEGKAETVIEKIAEENPELKELIKEQTTETKTAVETQAEIKEEAQTEAQVETQNTEETYAKSHSRTTTEYVKPIEIQEDSSNQGGKGIDSMTYEEIMSADSATQRSIARQFSSSEEYMEWLDKKKANSGIKEGNMNGSYEAILGE